MLQTKKLEIYPTSRAVRQKIKNELTSDQILPKFITIGEFEKKIILVPNRVFIDQDERVLLLNQASKFSNFENLHIQQEFFAFLKNSTFLFSFFDELSIEMVDIENLSNYDTYALYNEHIEILSTLQQRYKLLLEEKGYVDKIILPKVYEINMPFLKNFNSIELYLEGYLNNFEFQLFDKVSQHIEFIINLNINEFNLKMLEKFKKFGILLEQDYSYKINFSKKSIISQKKYIKKKTNYTIYPINNKISQIAFIKKKIYDYIQLGIKPEEIAIVLPDSQFATNLKLFDDENYFNFAMGFSYKESKIYKKIKAMYDYYKDMNIEARYRLQRLNIDIDQLHVFYKEWNKQHDEQTLYKTFLNFIENEKKDTQDIEIYLEELHMFSKLLKKLKHQPFHKILYLFLNRISKRSLDDTKGGKITVLEILETRGISFKGVVIPDFNENIVPHTSNKDLFLSSELRYFAKLPTSIDRENLQKYYYKQLFDKADEVSISYVYDEQNQPSRFLDELKINKTSKKISNLENILFKPSTQKKHYEKKDLILDYDFTKTPLSSTSLKTYLECKRAYYFKYIKKINHAEIPKEQNDDRYIGILIHEALKECYEKNRTYSSQSDLLYDIQSFLYKKSQDSLNLKFLIDLWIEKLKAFIEHEIKRFNDGYIVYDTEKTLNTKIDQFTITGKIDRIDIKNNFLDIIDYKSGTIKQQTKRNIEKSTNFQLQFYYLLTSKLGKINKCYYYDLNNALLIEDQFFDEKLDILYKVLNSLKTKKQNFTQTDELKICKYCPYIKMCGRVK